MLGCWVKGLEQAAPVCGVLSKADAEACACGRPKRTSLGVVESIWAANQAKQSQQPELLYQAAVLANRQQHPQSQLHMFGWHIFGWHS